MCRNHAQHALHCLCLVNEYTILYFCKCQPAATLGHILLLRQCFNKLGDTYQVYCNTYKTQVMATHHGSAGQPFDRDATPHGKDTEVDYDHEDTGDFEPIGQENDTNLVNLAWELDDLCPRVQAQRRSTSSKPYTA